MLTETVNEYMIAKAMSTNWPVKNIRASSIGNCSRNIVYDMLGYKQPIVALRALRAMSNGEYFHERVQKLLKDAGILIAEELKIKNETLRISSRMDCLIHNPDQTVLIDTTITILNNDGTIAYSGPQGNVAIAELKSANNRKYESVLKYGPDHKHVDQLQLYLMETGVENGVLLYENKDNQEWHEAWLKSNPVAQDALKAKILNILWHVDNLKVPPREHTKSSYDCKYCDHREKCWGEAAEVIALDKIL